MTLRKPSREVSSFLNSFPQVGGITRLIDITIENAAAAYVDGDVIDDIKTITDAVRLAGGSGIIQSVQLVDSDNQAGNVEVYFFSELITVAADNAAFAPSAADMQKMIAVADDGAPINLSAYTTINSIDVSGLTKINAPYQDTGSEEAIYVLLVANGSITWTAASALTLRIGVLVD